MINTLIEAASRIRAFFGQRERDVEFDGELASHIDLATDENIRRGMPPDEARRQAMIRLGGVETAKEKHRESRGLPALETVLQDVRYALRTLRRDAGFTIVAVLILGLGIGANTAVFSVIDTVLLRPLPFHNARQLVWVEDSEGHTGLSSATFPVGVFEAMRSNNRSFEDMTAYFAFFGFGDYKLTGRGKPQRFVGLPVAQNFFPMLGVEPALGRLFLREESQQHGRRAALLSHALWQQRFGSDPKIVGQSLTLNNEAVSVVGVLPASFDFGSVFSPGTRVDFYVPAVMDDMRQWGNTLAVIGRLKPGVTLGAARAEFNVLQPALKRSHPDWFGAYTPHFTALKEYVSGKLRRSLIVLWCAVALILLIACVNLANLLLARATSRTKEFAVRTALGAGRARIIRQLLTECLVLSIAGAALGLAFALAITRYLAGSASIALPLIRDIRVDGTALAFTLLVTIGSALLFGLAPGLRAAGGRIQDALKESSRGASEGRAHARFRAALVITEVALACVLLVGSGLLLRSFLRLLEVDLGFQPSRALAVRIDYEDNASNSQRNAFVREMLRRVQNIPGVEAAGISDSLPLAQNRSWTIRPKGKEYRRGTEPSAFVYVITPGYFKAMGMRLISGRDIAWRDTEKTEPVILINEAAARTMWPDEDPIGKIARLGKDQTRVIGIVGNVRESSVENQAAPEMFLPSTQADPSGAELIIRTSLPAQSIAPPVREAVRSLSPNQAVADFQPLQQLVDRAVSPRRFFALLVAAFAALGLVLASLGIYGVVSYSVARQTPEIGIRMALGASAAELQTSVIAKTLRMAITGIAVGMLVSFAMGRWIESLLFGVSPFDPAIFGGMISLLVLVALIAGYIPARRALRIDPMVALRSE